jgi:uncharacterized protein YbaR (Trm112 family)
MLSTPHFYDDPTSFDALYDSMLKCKKGVMWKESVTHFVLNGVEECLKLEKDLKTGSYRERPVKIVHITRPKKREAISISFRDRVYQRSLNDNKLYPIMTKSFIRANCACQGGKGTDFARRLILEMLRRYFRKYGCEGYVLQCDIHAYYPSMRHDVVEAMFRQRLDDTTFHQVQTILKNQYQGEVGYCPGSQMIQIAGISLLDPMDHYIKECLGTQFYIRYMDDFICLSPYSTGQFFRMEYIKEYLCKMGMELNPTKSRIYRISDGIPMLGFVFHLSKTGKAYMTLIPDNVNAERKKLSHMVSGNIGRNKVDESYGCWRSHASKGKTHHLVKMMDDYYYDLWREKCR